MSRTLRILGALLAILLVTCVPSALAQDSGSAQVYACAKVDGSVHVIDAAATCNPGERRLALATVQSKDNRSELGRNLVLLLATAITSGLLVPYVLKRIDYRRSEELRERESRTTRESKVIDAQVRLLESLSRVLWRWRYLVMAVTYYGLRSADPRYHDACRKYDSDVWNVLNRFRLEVSRSQRLASKRVYSVLLDFYQLMVDTDQRIQQIQASKGDGDKLKVGFSGLNKEVFETVTPRIDAILNDVAQEMGLVGRAISSEQIRRTPTSTSSV